MNAKLHPALIPKIRALKGKLPASVVGARFGVKPWAIWNIWNGKTWKKV